MKLRRSALMIISLFITYTFLGQDVEKSYDLNQFGALKLAESANLEASKINKNISIAILNASGVTLLLLKGDQVGPHYTEASRRKAYTSVSTKTPSFDLMNAAASSKVAQKINVQII